MYYKMICTRCKHDNASNATYCENCGRKIPLSQRIQTKTLIGLKSLSTLEIILILLVIEFAVIIIFGLDVNELNNHKSNHWYSEFIDL